MGHRGSMATFRRSHGLLLLCTCVGVQASQYGRSCYNGTDGTYPENKDAAGNIQPGDSLLCASERTVKCENSLLYTKLGRGYAVTCLESPYRPDCASGLALPLEQAMGRGTMGFLYFIAMCYCFLGIAIISDIFMESIEEITAQTKEITVPHDDYKAGLERDGCQPVAHGSWILRAGNHACRCGAVQQYAVWPQSSDIWKTRCVDHCGLSCFQSPLHHGDRRVFSRRRQEEDRHVRRVPHHRFFLHCYLWLDGVRAAARAGQVRSQLLRWRGRRGNALGGSDYARHDAHHDFPRMGAGQSVVGQMLLQAK